MLNFIISLKELVFQIFVLIVMSLDYIIVLNYINRTLRIKNTHGFQSGIKRDNSIAGGFMYIQM